MRQRRVCNALPGTGAFVAYKECVYDRIVQLLIPADAKRSSATGAACRCDKAKVLTIKSFDCRQEFDEAWSLVDETSSTEGESGSMRMLLPTTAGKILHGIHFWMTREEAMEY